MVDRIHTDLVVAGEGVHEAEEFMTDRGVHYEINPRLRETILWAGPVDVREIDAKPPLVVCFFDENNVSQPFWVFHFSDCRFLEELADLFINHLLSFWGKTPYLLLDRLKGGIDVQPVGNHCRVDLAYVFLFPGEYLHVLL